MKERKKQTNKGKRKQLVNAAIDNDRVSLTKNAKKLGVHQIYVQMRRAEVVQKKIYQSGLLRRPETRQYKSCWKLMTLMA